jgi:hypothetical protein
MVFVVVRRRDAAPGSGRGGLAFALGVVTLLSLRPSRFELSAG